MCLDCDWEDFAKDIEEKLGDEDYSWAEATLTGIQETVLKMRHATERQKEAIENITMAVERKK